MSDHPLLRAALAEVLDGDVYEMDDWGDYDECPHVDISLLITALGPNADAMEDGLRRYEPHPGEQHMFRTACMLCGRNGDIVLSIVGSDERITIDDPEAPTDE